MPNLKGAIPKASIATGNAKGLLERARRIALRSRKHGDLEQALELLRRAASKGSEEADYAIGTWYAFGIVLPKDASRAVKYFRRAAAKKYRPAMFNLAIAFETGQGVKRDPERAFKLYVKCARDGDRDAAKSVYRCLYHGIGVRRDRLIAELIADFIDKGFSCKRV